MSIFTNMAMGAIMKTSFPTIDRRLCWNMRPHKDRCEDCMNVCPQHLFERASIVKNWTGCTDCGLCVSVCRARCIVPSKEQVEKDLKQMENPNDKVWIGCDRSARRNDVIRECVGSFSWETLAYLSLSKQLVLDLTPCAECPQTACVEHVRKEMQRIVEFLGADLFSARITLAEEENDAPYEETAYGRREIVEHLAAGSKSGTRLLLSMIPGLEEEEDTHAFDFRRVLHLRTKQIHERMANPPTFGYYLPSINENCYGCGRCERSCRADALKIVTGEDGVSRIVVTPWKCSECGLCTRTCVDKAMDGMVLRQVATLGPVSVRKLKIVYCPECNKPMAPDSEGGICKVCMSRRRMQERREAAQARAKERAEQRAKEEAEKAAAAAAAAENAPAPEEAQAAPAGTAEAPIETAAAPIETAAASIEKAAAPIGTAAASAEAPAAPAEAPAPEAAQ